MEATIETPTTTPTTVVETPAAPAISEPSSTPAVSQRPPTAREALERVAAKEAGADPAKAPAAITPAGTEPAPSAENTQGEPPKERWPDILTNARAKAATEAVQQRDRQWQKEAGWVMSLPPERRAAAPDLVRDFYANPALFIFNVSQAIQNDPRWGPQLRGLMGGGNGNGHAAPVSDEPQPDVEVIVNPQTGQSVKTYSADQLAKREEWLRKQWLGPYEEERRSARAQQEQVELERQVNAGADAIMGRITTILDGRADLFTHVDALVARGTDAIDAALEVRKQYIVPQQQQQATVSAAETMRRKAVAGNTANGGGATTTPIARPKTAKELAALLESLDARG